jgi:hypothetical protein
MNEPSSELPIVQSIANQTDVKVSSAASVNSDSEAEVELISENEPDVDTPSWESLISESGPDAIDIRPATEVS